MDRRIFGIENEYGVTCTFDGQRRLTPDEVARYLFRKVVSWGRSSNVFLSNGSRLYLDVGSHPEYATPECDDVRQLVTHDKAGERIVEGLVADAQQRITDEGIAGEIYVFKNNTDSAGNSYGCHENYLVGRAGEFQKLSDVLIPFLVSRQLICGAGKVTTTSRGATYCVSQRADHIWEGVSSATTRSRPIINTRDEPHADAEKYRRLHVIVGDSNMSETTTHAQDRVGRPGPADDRGRCRHARPHAGEPDPGHPRDQPRHDRPRAWSSSPTAASSAGCRSSASTTSGRRRSPTARAWTTRMHKSVLDLWQRTLSAIENQDLEQVGTEIDWVMKYLLLDRYAVKHGLSLDEPADRPARPRLPRHQPPARAVLPAAAARQGDAGSPATSRSSRPRRCRRRRPGPSCAATSSAPRRSTGATSPWTGCT